MFDFRNGDNGEIFREQEEAGKEQPECTGIESDLPDGRAVVGRPAGRQVIPVQRGNDDHETLEPHTNVHDNTHEEGDEQIPSELFEPEDLRT